MAMWNKAGVVVLLLWSCQSAHQKIRSRSRVFLILSSISTHRSPGGIKRTSRFLWTSSKSGFWSILSLVSVKLKWLTNFLNLIGLQKVTNGSASVICIDNMWHWDPISAVSAYFRSASLIDQVLTRLPCSDEGHTYVDWRQLRYIYSPLWCTMPEFWLGPDTNELFCIYKSYDVYLFNSSGQYL